jgi:hypothetical protein
MGMLTKTLSRRAEYWRDYHAIAADPSAGTIVPVRSKRLYQGTKRLHQTSFTLALTREVPAVFTVFAAAASALQGKHDTAGYMLAGAEVIAGVGVLAAIVLEARHLFGRRAEHAHATPNSAPRVDASNLAAAALGYVEAWHHAHVVGHFKLFSPYIVGATASLLVAALKNRPISKRRLRRQLHVGITPAGISYLAGPRLRWRAAWTEVAAVEHGHGELAVRLHDGRRHVMRADDHLDGDSVLTETRAAIAAHASHVPGAVSGATFAGPASDARAAGSKASV